MLLQATQAAWGPGTAAGAAQAARSLAHITVPRASAIAALSVASSSSRSPHSDRTCATRSMHTTPWPASTQRSTAHRICRDARAGLPSSSSSSTSLITLRLNSAKQSYARQQIRGIVMLPPDRIKTSPEQDTARRTPTLFNPIYTEEDLKSVQIVHFKPENFGDRVAFALMRVARWAFDVATRYKHPPSFPRVKSAQDKIVTTPMYDPKKPSRLNPRIEAAAEAVQARESADQADKMAAAADGASVPSTPSSTRQAATSREEKEVAEKMAEAQPEEMTLEEMRKRGIAMTPEQWLIRIVFLESIAGVPGFVAAAVRHLHSLRLMRRDKGWIRTLLEDAENERMHLLTFLTYAEPGVFLRTMILGAQGVFFNAFFLAYLLAPRAAHRFVGALEEEAVLTYTNIVNDVKEGRLPEWEDLPACQIAREYWKMPDDAKMLDILLAVRSDESTHRFIHHSLGSLDQKKDFNPFANQMPSAKLRGQVAGLTREQAVEWAAKAEKEAKNYQHSGPHMATQGHSSESRSRHSP